MEFLQFSEQGLQIVQTFGYPGLFLVNLLSTSTVFFPVPGYVLVFIFGGALNPFLVALFSAFGAALGETVSYLVGRGGGYILKKKQKKHFIKGKQWFERKRGFLIIVIFAATPLPFDAVGILSGSLNYNFKRFVLATFLGKLLGYLVLALAGFYGVNWVLNAFELKF